MPFVKIPTGPDALSNDHIEGGLILPLAVRLPGEFSMGLMAEIDVLHRGRDEGYGIDFVHTATVGHRIAGALSGYVEYVGVAPLDGEGDYRAIASGGLTYALSEDLVLDAGGTLGLIDNAEDFGVFVGLSRRF